MVLAIRFCAQFGASGRDSVSRKTGGTWYSTLAQGYCGDGTAPAPAGCTWKVTNVDKVINKTCSDRSIYNAIESYGAKNGACFANANCATGLARNTSATCWIDCFYEVLLGPGGGQPGGAITGMPVEILFDAWSKPFESVDPAQGGCPPETDCKVLSPFCRTSQFIQKNKKKSGTGIFNSPLA